MKFLRDYDEVLDSTVMSILEQNFVEGIRSTSQTGETEPITNIPGNTSMFPELAGEIDDTLASPKNKVEKGKLTTEISADEWADAGLSDLVDKYIVGIGHYNKRMKTVISSNVSWAYAGASCAAELVDSIFSRIESLRDTKCTKQVKQRALVDLFKVLKNQGYSSMKWSAPPQIRESHQVLQLPIPSIKDTSNSTRYSLEKGERYFHRCQVELSRLRSEISMLGSQYMSQREMALMQGYSDHMFFYLCQERCVLADMIDTITGFESFFNSYRDINDSMPLNQERLSRDRVSFEQSIASAIEGLRQIVLLLKEASPLLDSGESQNKVRDVITILTGCSQKLEESYSQSKGSGPVSFARIHIIRDVMSQVLHDSNQELLSCAKVCDDDFPASLFGSCISNIDQALQLALSFAEPSIDSNMEGSNDENVLRTLELISSLVQSTLISAQSICKSSKDAAQIASLDKLSSSQDEFRVCDSHRHMINEWDGLRLPQINENIQELSNSLLALHDKEVSHKSIYSLCTISAMNSFVLVRNVLRLSKGRLEDTASFYRHHTKLLYVLLRVFRVLIAKGFCSDEVSDGGEGDGEGGAGEMKFEDDVEGTGMGEGDGKNDVTDQIENEEQLLGLKGDDQQEATSSQEKKELNQDEVDTGMEMEGDFEGDTFDMPEQQEDEKNDQEDGDNEEEIDREMGDGSDPNEQVSAEIER